MSWNTGVMAGGAVLLTLALGGVRGLPAMVALFVSYWLVRSIHIAAAAHQERRSQERFAQQREAKRRAEQERASQQRRRQAEQERGTQKPQRQSERAANQDNEWWSVLGVPPHASADEIRHTYRRKIKQCHPDLVGGLAPELLELAEKTTRMLNAAYSEANRARRNASTVNVSKAR